MRAFLLGGGLEPPRLTAYAPQTYVSAISPPERCGGTELVSRRRELASQNSGVAGVQELQNGELLLILWPIWNHGPRSVSALRTADAS
jgi:hypothetical protein